MNPVNQSVSAGMWGFILFFVLALVLVLLVRRMLRRMRNMRNTAIARGDDLAAEAAQRRAERHRRER